MFHLTSRDKNSSACTSAAFRKSPVQSTITEDTSDNKRVKAIHILGTAKCYDISTLIEKDAKAKIVRNGTNIKSIGSTFHASYVNGAGTQDLRIETVITQEEEGAIEVEPVGTGFPLKSLDDIQESVTLSIMSSSGSDTETDSEATGKKKRSAFSSRVGKRWIFLIFAFLIIIAVCIIGVLATNVSKNAKSNSRLITTAANSIQKNGTDAVGVTNQIPSSTQEPVEPIDSPTTTTATDSPTTASTIVSVNDTGWLEESEPVASTRPTTSPTAAQTEFITEVVTEAATEVLTEAVTQTPTHITTMAVPPTSMPTTVPPSSTPSSTPTPMPTDITCGSAPNLVILTDCQTDGVESWAVNRLLFCFSQTRDGDWYWIRDSNESFDRWDYTEGASTGILDFDTIPPGDYMVSLVRDSMRPYDILLTKQVTVPDCSSASF